MARPNLNTDSFLAHIFHPKKSAKPTGLRKTALTGLKGGRKKARLTAFNKMDAVKQEILRASGTRESYLRGETSLADAKRNLRGHAVSRGITKPLKNRPVSRGEHDDIWAVRNHILRTVRTTRLNVRHVEENTLLMTAQQRKDALKIKDFDEYRTQATGVKDKWKVVYDNGVTASVLWYN